ncbi:aldehyde dehydrogenase family protein [Curtobacterium sp. MCJR17_043]|uniref:aldehyde dehydrogenase family protein n=1 Tax=Curtobacterium sp. MCJR17_043 TaxID=2175660 RepID=UPI0024DF7E0F|nr:aldehyde dehydrogenase family protein [Curtobacterium sp. MCJR17_043]WIB37145.1 aldehyde dehydrogenase family protein [Curtobacterium sp. MCJR17_043]
MLDLVAHQLEVRRAALVEVVVAETAMTLTDADRQVSAAVDAAHHAADRARHLTDVAGAVFVPPRLTVVVPPWNSPVATPADGVLSALAAGSGVVLKPSPPRQAVRRRARRRALGRRGPALAPAARRPRRRRTRP